MNVHTSVLAEKSGCMAIDLTDCQDLKWKNNCPDGKNTWPAIGRPPRTH
jgi:hypothetical protein